MRVMNDRADAEAPRATPTDVGAPAGPAPGSDGSVKETIESIIVAFILAFIFRGFVVEAFVIPTGSMAPTLLGAHMRFDCPDCGWRFDVNYASETGDADDVSIPSHAVIPQRVTERDASAPNGTRTTTRLVNRVLSIHCPNCGYKLPRADPNDPINDATAPPVRYGDRILVLKYLYLLSEPQRWDVVVFKSPYQPEKYDYGQNYIKRLIGKPGEAVYILDGDIYVGEPDAPADQFVVQTKPDHVQDALWRIVYDNDYQPRGRGVWVQPWKTAPGENGWDTAGRDFRFDNMQAAATLRFDATANADKHALTDWLAYDVTASQQQQHEPGRSPPPDTHHYPSYTPQNFVADLKLSLYYRRDAGDGPLTLEMTKLGHTFTARLTPDEAQVFMTAPGGGEPVPVGAPVPLRGRGRGRAVYVEFLNVDYQVKLRLDGKEVIRTTPEQYRPDMTSLLKAADEVKRLERPEVRIRAERQTATLSHVGLWRDVYYLNRDGAGSGNPVRWGSPHDFPHHMITLGPEEYFVLGDNSPLSGDARTWHAPINLPDEDLDVLDGRVPGRFLIGKAFFVYWPAGYRPVQSAPALVPNFGDMRFIH